MEEADPRYRWKILAMVYVCMIAFALVFQSVPPILNLIISELNIDYAQAGLLMGLIAMPGIFIAIPSGIISDRFGMKKVGIGSLILMTTGTFIVWISDNFLSMCIGRSVSGVGAMTLAIELPQLLSRWFRSKELGVGMGVYSTAMPLGSITSLNIFSALGKNLGWRAPISLTTAASGVAFLVFLRLFKEPPVEAKQTRKEAGNGLFSTIAQVGVPIWLVALAWMWFNAATISFMTFSSDFFVSKGYEIGFAGFMSSIVMMGSLFLSPLIGFLVYRFGKEEAFIASGAIFLSSLLFFVPISSSFIPLLILIAVFTAFVPTPIFSLPAKLVQPENLGVGFGIYTMCQNIGILGGPYLAGVMKDLTGQYLSSFYLISLFALLAAVSISILNMMRSKATLSKC